MSSRHDADPLHLRHVASRTGLPEWFVACAASLALTFSFSIVQFVLVCTPLRLALAPVLAVGETDDPPILQPLWTALLTNEPWGTYVSAAAFPGILASVYYFVSCMVYSAIDIVNAPSFNDKYRLQPGAPQRPDAWAHALFLTGSHYVLLIVPGILWQVATQGPWLYWDGSPCVWGCDGARLFPSAAPRLDHMLIHLVICFVVFDASYHFWHWTHHASPVLYRHIHSIHHEYSAPFCWVTQHEHVLELLVVSLWSILVPSALGCHPLTMWAFMIGAVQVSIEAHSGYSLGLTAPLQRVLPLGLWGGNAHHDNHHKLPRRNFQPFFTYLDRAFGTYHGDVHGVKVA